MKQRCRMLLLIMICQIGFVRSLQTEIQIPSILDEKLDEFKSMDYKEMYHKPINVSFGEELTIVLPSFDSLYNPNTFSIRYLSDQEYSSSLILLNTLNANHTEHDFERQEAKPNQFQPQIGTPVSETQLPLKCSYNPPKAKVYEVISKVNDQVGSGQFDFQNKMYINVGSKQLFYILNSKSMALSVYYYNDASIKFLSSFQLPADRKQNNYQGYKEHQVSMALNSKQTLLYIFSQAGIWTIQTRTFLTNIKREEVISGLDIVQLGGLNKVIKGKGQYFVGIRRMQNAYLIPEPSSSQKRSHEMISFFKGNRIIPVDIAIAEPYLFILDIFKGVYVFQISSENKAQEIFKIDTPNFPHYHQMFLFETSTLFISFNDRDGSKVVEINLNLEYRRAELVRYFKTDNYISFIQTYRILTSSTGFFLSEIKKNQEIDMKHILNSAETLLFMISNYHQLHVYPFNVDPRTINSMQNGVKIYYPKIIQIHHLLEDRFIAVTEDSIDYIRISINKPEVSCFIGSKFNPAFSVDPDHFRITVKSNVSTCEFRSQLLPHKIFYNENCQLTTEYLIHLNNPGRNNLKKVITYGLVIVVVTAFVFGLCFLAQWRNQKLVVLQRLKDQILKFRNKHRRMQPFVEEQVLQKREIQMEVPQDIEFIPNE